MKKILMMIGLACLLSVRLFSQIIEFEVEIKYKNEDTAKTGEVAITVTSGKPDFIFFITTYDFVDSQVIYKSEKTRKNHYTFKDVKPGKYLVKIQEDNGNYAAKSIVIEN